MHLRVLRNLCPTFCGPFLLAAKLVQTDGGWFVASAKALTLPSLAASAGVLFLRRSAQQNPFLHGNAVYGESLLTGIDQAHIYFATV